MVTRNNSNHVSYEAESLMSTAIPSVTPESQKGWRRYVPQKALSHIGLLVALMIYTVGGGLVFKVLESPGEISRISHHRKELKLKKERLVEAIVNISRYDLNDSFVIDGINEYERAIEEASRNGVPLLAKDEMKWNTLQAVFFSSTVLTTIGYGNVVPVTFWGRTFCIGFALIGIPLTLTVIADLGKLFASAVSMFAKYMPKFTACRTIAANNETAKRSLYAFAAVLFLFVYLSAGAGLFTLWEEDWNFGDGFYFCFVTMTTIGFGDIVPKKPKYMLLCTLYILIGLALTSTIIELVRRQYARSWQQLRALSGPLAETLRRLNASGLSVDVSSLHNDLRKVLTVVTMPRLSGGRDGDMTEKKQLEWEAAVEAVIRDITAPLPQQKKPPVVQIILYESSV